MSYITIEQHPTHKTQRIARGSVPGPDSTYPNLYVEIAYKVDEKTNRVNPATKDHDIKILVAPYGVGLSDDFHAPPFGVDKRVEGVIIRFEFICSVSLLGTTKVHLGIKDFFGIDKDVAPVRAMALVGGWINTVTGDGDLFYRKYGNFERLRGH